MRTKPILWALCPLAMLAAAILVGSQVAQSRAQVVDQTPSHIEPPKSVATSKNQKEKICKASDLIGMAIYSQSDDSKIGSINDLVLDQNGHIKYVAVSFGGFLGMGSKLFAVPFEAINFENTDGAHARIDVTEEAQKLNKGFDQNVWPTEADRAFTNGNMRRQASATAISR